MMTTPKERPEVLPGKTYKLNTGCGNIYVTINDHEGQPVVYPHFLDTYAANFSCSFLASAGVL